MVVERRGLPTDRVAPGDRLLARRGVAPGATETARELVARVDTAWAVPLARLTAAYERVRFGGAVLTAEETAEVTTALEALAAAVRARCPG